MVAILGILRLLQSPNSFTSESDGLYDTLANTDVLVAAL